MGGERLCAAHGYPPPTGPACADEEKAYARGVALASLLSEPSDRVAMQVGRWVGGWVLHPASQPACMQVHQGVVCVCV